MEEAVGRVARPQLGEEWHCRWGGMAQWAANVDLGMRPGTRLVLP